MKSYPIERGPRLSHIDRSDPKSDGKPQTYVFHYEMDDSYGTWVRITYIKTYPGQGPGLQEYEVQISVTSDQNYTGPEILMRHHAQIAIALALHQEDSDWAQVDDEHWDSEDAK